MIGLIRSEEDKRMINVYFSESLLKRIHEDIFGKDLSWKESSFTSATLKEFLLDKEKEGGKRFLLRKLAQKPLLKSESAHLLRERCLDEKTVSEIIVHLDSLSFYDDAYVVESKIRSRMCRNLGKERIRNDLWKERIPEEVFEEAFKKVESEENLDPVTQILTFIKKTVKDGVLEDYATKQRLIAKLMRRGFELDDIHEAIREKLRLQGELDD